MARLLIQGEGKFLEAEVDLKTGSLTSISLPVDPRDLAHFGTVGHVYNFDLYHQRIFILPKDDSDGVLDFRVAGALYFNTILEAADSIGADYVFPSISSLVGRLTFVHETIESHLTFYMKR